MKKTQKKIVAREFLILLVPSIIFIIYLSIIFSVEVNYDNKYHKLTKELEYLENEGVPYGVQIYSYVKQKASGFLKGDYALMYNNNFWVFSNRKDFLEKVKDSSLAGHLYDALKEHKEMNYSKPEFVAELNVEYTQYFEQVDNMRHDSYLLNNQRMDFKKTLC